MIHSPKVILLIQPDRGFDRGVLNGIFRYADLNGPWTFYHNPPEYMRARTKTSLQLFKKWGVEGILCSFFKYQSLRYRGIFTVLLDLNYYKGKIPGIVTEDTHVGRLAAEYFNKQGFRHYAFCGFEDLQWSKKRGRSYSEVLETVGVKVWFYQDMEVKTKIIEDHYNHLTKWLRGLPKPIGVFCANDDMALFVSECCCLTGLKVPHEVAILGVDDDEYTCKLAYPPISSISIASENAGYQAAALLDQLMQEKEIMSGQRIVAYPTHVVSRQSTNSLVVEDPEVREAISFIRENAGRVVQVDEVVEFVGLSHRILNQHFYDQFGCSILKQVTKARCDYIIRLLIETDIPIFQIAQKLGYSSDRHISRYFRRATGLTPLEYRMKNRML